MAHITETYKLNMMPGGIPLMVNVSQDDALWKSLKFQLINGSQYMTIPSGTIALINGKKADGKGFSYQMTVNASDHSVQIDVQKQMTTSAGITLCEVSLQNGTSIIGSANFILRVEKNPLDDAVMSDSDLKAVTEVLAKMSDALNSADIATRKANEAAASAGKAADSASSASTSASNSASSATASGNSATSAKNSADSAATSASSASQSAINASGSESAAATSASNAKTSETNASESANEARKSEINAAASAKEAASMTATGINDRINMLEYMVRYNDFFAPVIDDDGNVIVDDSGNAVVGNWKYKII